MVTQTYRANTRVVFKGNTGLLTDILHIQKHMSYTQARA